jgi:DNA-binding NarL/FixJ family response regulator
MAQDVTFIVHREWLDSIKNLPIEQQDKIIAEFVRYGTDLGLKHPDDALTQSFVNILKSRIDFSKNKYEKKVQAGKSAGRKKKVDDDEILRLALGGMKSAEIAEKLGVSKSTIDHSDGWKRRNL